MADDRFTRHGRSVPSGRLSRLGTFGRLAGGVMSGVVAEGARRLAAGERPRVGDLLLTPGNMVRVADRLAHLRGAAMKLGQMISLDAGDFLPPELSDILARLRDNAQHMPPAQLERVLTEAWGQGWRARFARFDTVPIAAASIGQVHRALTQDGREIAVKVQYPGVKESIDADIDNVATLLRVSGLLPAELDIAPLLAGAKAQLHEEADYAREGAQMRRFGALLAGSPHFVVPVWHENLSTDGVLAMSFEEGMPIEQVAFAGQEERDALAAALIELVLKELFAFGVMQTDPNFANYRYRFGTRQIVVLDFGAVQEVRAETAQGYRAMVAATLARDHAAVREAALGAGFVNAAVLERHRATMDRMIDVVLDLVHRPGLFDFGDRAFVGVLREEGMRVAADRATWHLPPAETLFVQRKISGTALLAARLGARVDVKGLAERFVAESL